MNTPAHLAASLFVWRKEADRTAAWAVATGAFLPDAPMFLFYAYQKAIGSSEKLIWNKLYFRDDWQLFFDVFNSIPLALIAAVVCYTCGLRNSALLACSVLLHLICDLPVHNDDAHRHFLPLTDWRFESPLSYWDPQHYGHIFFVCELLFAIAASVFVWRCGHSTTLQRLGLGTLGLYVAGVVFAAIVWMS